VRRKGGKRKKDVIGEKYQSTDPEGGGGPHTPRGRKGEERFLLSKRGGGRGQKARVLIDWPKKKRGII